MFVAATRRATATVVEKSLKRSKALASNTLSRRCQSTKSPGFLEADAGSFATRTHHAMTTSLAILTPIFFMVPDSFTDGFLNKMFGVGLAANIAAHSWIGMNYVCTDYVPKFFPKSFLGPSRIFNVGLAAVTFLGLAKVSLSSPGGIKGCIKGLWNPPPPAAKIEDGSKKKK